MATQTNYAPGEVVKRGKVIYNADIRDLVEPEHVGKYLAINVETGEWEMGEDHDETILRAHSKFNHPGIYMMRIGYAAATTMGLSLRSK